MTWTRRGSWSGKQLYGVAYGGGQFVAVGWDHWNQVDVILYFTHWYEVDGEERGDHHSPAAATGQGEAKPAGYLEMT